MSLPTMILGSAELGLNLLTARGQRRAADESRRTARAEDRLRQVMITRQARVDTSERLERFRAASGSQRAGLAAMGVAGGRTARLFQQQAQLQFQRAQGMADAQTSAQRSQSRVQHRQQAAQARAQAAQSRVNMFSSALQFGQQAYQVAEQEEVL